MNVSNAACTNSIESDWHHAKVSMPRYGVHQGMHASYLAEFMWRCKYSDSDNFLQLMNDLNEAFKLKYLSQSPK